MYKEGEAIIRDSISCEKPMVAKVWAPGAHSLGASLASACDFVYAADDATFSDPHLSGLGAAQQWLDGGTLARVRVLAGHQVGYQAAVRVIHHQRLTGQGRTPEPA